MSGGFYAETTSNAESVPYHNVIMYELIILMVFQQTEVIRFPALLVSFINVARCRL